MPADDQEDWDRIGNQWRDEQRFRLWRRHSDAVNGTLVSRWLGDAAPGRALKTDVFDEAVAEGVYPILNQLGYSVVGIDVSTSVLDQAGQRHSGLKTVAADVRSLPFADEAFDAVVSNSTLDHFENISEIHVALAECARVLRPGGKLIVTLDNPANPIVKLRNMLPMNWLKKTGLVPYYVGATMGLRELRQAVGKTGLEIVDTTAVLHCPRVLCVAATEWLSGPRWSAHGGGLLRFLGTFETLETWPTRCLTGHFVAVLAQKAAGAPITNEPCAS